MSDKVIKAFNVPADILRSIYVPAKEFPDFLVCRECDHWDGGPHAIDCRLGWLQWADVILTEQRRSSTLIVAAIVRALGGSVQVLNADLVSIRPDDALVRTNETDCIILTYRPSIR